MLTQEMLHDRAMKGGLAHAARLANDPAYKENFSRLMRRKMRLHWRRKRVIQTTSEPKPSLVKANSSNGNGAMIVGRHSSLAKAMASIDKQIADAQVQIKGLEARKQILTTAANLVKETLH